MFLSTASSAAFQLCLALTVAFPSSLSPQVRDIPSINVAQLQTIAPKSTSCSSGATMCDISQCRTASQAVPLINDAFNRYNISTPNEQAAVVGTMAFESAQFQCSLPITPTLGKGTRNMQSSKYNLAYALHLNLITSSESNATIALNELVANDTSDFGSAAWFLVTQCPPSIKDGLQNGLTGWQNYVSQCLGTELEDDRNSTWSNAVTSLGGGQ